MNPPYDEPSEMQDVYLDNLDAVEPYLFIPPLKRTFGTELDIKFKAIRMRIGRRPRAVNLRKWYEKSGRALPEDLELYVSYDLWLILHTVSIMDEGGWESVQQFGYQVQFPEEPKVIIVDLMPQTQFIKRVDLSFKSETNLHVNGKAAVPEALRAPIGDKEIFSFGAELTSSNDARIAAQLSFSVMTPFVIAVGVGDFTSEWNFHKEKQPLVGDQVIAQVVLTPRHLEKLPFQARLYTNLPTFNLLPNRLRSKWIKLECDLEE